MGPQRSTQPGTVELVVESLVQQLCGSIGKLDAEVRATQNLERRGREVGIGLGVQKVDSIDGRNTAHAIGRSYDRQSSRESV
jgi:hypothetical protein